MTTSVKLEEFREKLVDMLNIYYPDYKIGQYLNGIGSIAWLSVIDNSTNLRVVEVIFVESFGSGDTVGGSLMVIDYVNSDSQRYAFIDNALDCVKSILTIASERKKTNEKQCQGEQEPVSPDEIRHITINPGKYYLVGGRCNGKTLFYQNLIKSLFNFKIKDVIFNDPATVIFWEDGEKTVVQCQDGEEFDPEKGLAMAISKRIFGNKHAYYDVFKKFVGKYKKKKFREALDNAMKITPDEIIRDGHRYVLADNEQESVPDENPREETVIASLTLSDVSLSPEDAKAVIKLDGKSEEGNDNET